MQEYRIIVLQRKNGSKYVKFMDSHEKDMNIGNNYDLDVGQEYIVSLVKPNRYRKIVDIRPHMGEEMANPSTEKTNEILNLKDFIPELDPYYYVPKVAKDFEKTYDEQLKRGKQPPVLITGPQGCGKTQFAVNRAARLKKPFIRVLCPQITERSEWWGHVEFRGGQTIFVPSLMIAILEGGGICLLDEFNRLEDQNNSNMYQLLDEGMTYVPWLKRIVKCHPETEIWATANIGWKFTGTYQLDAAMNDRFVRLPLQYLSFAKNISESDLLDSEVNILVKKIGINKKMAEDLVKIAHLTRIRAKEGDIPEGISLRILLRWAEFIKSGMKQLEAAEYTVIPVISDPGEEATLRTMLQGFLREIIEDE